jgi:hypothetical protein
MMQTQTQVPPALQVLMSMGAQPTAPGPMGQPIPTIASQKVEQQAQGLEALMPGVRQQAMQSAQAAQPVTQAQLQQALQQREPVMAAEGGLMQLPAQNMRFAEGGVIGYAGTDGSDVELDVSGRIKKALRDWYERTERGYMERAGATPEMIAQKLGQAKPAPTEAPEASYSNESRIGLASKPVPVAEPNVRPTGIADPRLARNTAARTQPRAEPSAPVEMLPDTRESTAVNPSEAALMYAQMQGGIKDLLERQSKPRERTPEELKEAAAREEDIKRRLGEIDASQQRFEQSKQERLASQQGRGLSDLASFLSRAGGAGSLFRGLGNAQIGMEPIFAARAAEEQKFREQELAFMDRLGERRNLVSDLRLASLKDDAGRAREDVARLRALDMEISKLGLGLGEKRAGELARAEQSREEQAARAKENALDRGSRERQAELDRKARFALQSMPGPEQQMIERAIKSLMDANPSMPYHEAYDKVRGAGRPERGVMTYDQASDNVQKLLDSPSGMMEVTNIRKQAKAAGQPEPSLIEVKEMLIRREMQGAGAARSGAAAPAAGAAPAVGTIMQGYRFKGGNPADKNNWEKV